MTVRDKTGRRRYVVFRIMADRPLTRGLLLRGLSELPRKTAKAPQLMAFDGQRGIVLLDHRDQTTTVPAFRAVTNLAGVPVRVETFRTSGTLRGLREKTAGDLLPSDGRRARPR